MSKMYSYELSFVNNISDYIMCKRVSENIPNKPYISQVVTLASHSPFTTFADSSSLILPKDMPADMANYIKSVNYTDNALGLLFDKFKNDSTIIMITGDHTIFHEEKRNEFKQYCSKNSFDIPVEKCFVPLIIYAPEINDKIVVTDTVYQMDIYPTLLHLLHQENYIWQGFGINLLNPNAKRKITAEEALKLSDAIIRNDYFRIRRNLK
jgi:phosphoglycerol transferase MdoB-like AlkP superfamily enzyme